MKTVNCPDCVKGCYTEIIGDQETNTTCTTCDGRGWFYLTSYLVKFFGFTEGKYWVSRDYENGELFINEDGRVDFLDSEYTTITLLREANIEQIKNLLKEEL